MKRFLAVAGLVLALSACVTVPAGVQTPSGPPTIPTAPIDLGNWRAATEAATLQGFERTVTDRYAVGLPITAVSADLRRNEFNCADAPRAERGTPPAQVCRRTVTNSGCTHTWQVHLFDEGGSDRLARTRALYDRRCGGDGLLGGPG
ncbi:MAG: hypothetical protein AB7O98_17070 [Hyphomonadaceae bacterium]